MRPFEGMKRLLVSFSGGETSAKMAYLIKQACLPFEVIFVFANTGEEHLKSLEFANYVDRRFDLGLVWVESVVRHNQRASCGHRIVDFESATRGPILFEEMIRKYGIPNRAYPHCTRALKTDPITSYARSIGWEAGSYHTAIGFRKDEVDRMSVNAEKNRIIYPLISVWPHRKDDINKFWRDQPHRLEISGYQGNCVWCWKKTLRKHQTLIQDDPSVYDTPARFERLYGTAGHNVDGTPRKFFREGKSTQDLIKASSQPFTRFDDENRVYEMELDTPGGCGESCEIDFDYLSEPARRQETGQKKDIRDLGGARQVKKRRYE